MSEKKNEITSQNGIISQTQSATSTADIEVTTANIFAKKSVFVLAAKMAETFSLSTIIPKDYQGSPSNCLIALEMANRIGTSPMMVMQNLYIVNGRPAWSSQFIVAMINSSKRYKTELQYDLKGSGDTLECTAYAINQADMKVTGPTITMQMAKDEGWYGKNGSKWKTMPEVMIRYRAASFFGRLHCPDLIMGIYATDEVIDMPPEDYTMVSDLHEANSTLIDMPNIQNPAEQKSNSEIQKQDAETPLSEQPNNGNVQETPKQTPASTPTSAYEQQTLEHVNSLAEADF